MRAVQGSDRHEVVALMRDGRQVRRGLRWADTAASSLAGPYSVEGRALVDRVPFIWLDRQDGREVVRLRTFKPDLMLVGNFGVILREAILDVPSVGTVNTHWSLLPLHRGPHPSTSVLLEGDDTTGLTFHVVNKRIDAGDILDQVAFGVQPDDTATSIYHRAVDLAGARIVALLDRIDKDGLKGTPQDLSQGSYHRRPTVQRATLDFERPAEELDRVVRALIRPMARFRCGGRTVYVSSARVVSDVHAEPGTVVQRSPKVVVATGEGGLALDVCYQLAPVPAPWPAPWNRVSVGTVLR
ncbi:MAG: methionyl-tRNA formyltransferase [Kiritimatiellia bacterium]|jgi:methionyl-tRNA formyltransferase